MKRIKTMPLEGKEEKVAPNSRIRGAFRKEFKTLYSCLQKSLRRLKSDLQKMGALSRYAPSALGATYLQEHAKVFQLPKGLMTLIVDQIDKAKKDA